MSPHGEIAHPRCLNVETRTAGLSTGASRETAGWASRRVHRGNGTEALLKSCDQFSGWGRCRLPVRPRSKLCAARKFVELAHEHRTTLLSPTCYRHPLPRRRSRASRRHSAEQPLRPRLRGPRRAWHTDTHRYETAASFREEFPPRLRTSGPRVLKQNRGNGGQGVWKVEALANIDGMIRCYVPGSQVAGTRRSRP